MKDISNKKLFTQKLVPAKIRKPVKAIILGFDTEYDSITKELLSVQLSYKGNSLFKVIRSNSDFSWDILYDIVKNFLSSIPNVHTGKNKVTTFILVSYFSIAEVQHLGYLDPRVSIFEFGQGNYDFSMQCEDQQRLYIVDLQKWFTGRSLANVAKDYGLEKLQYDRTNIHRSCLKTKEFRKYAVNDAIIVEEIFNRIRDFFLSTYSVDIIRTKTPSNTSMTIFRTHYLHEVKSNRKLTVRRMALACSWGGNNQAFIRGKYTGIFYEYDGKSMYPSSTICLLKLPDEVNWKRAKDIDDFMGKDNIGGIGVFEFCFPSDCKYPSLPIFHKTGLFYPLQGLSFCTLCEIKYALSQGAKIKLREGYIFKDGKTEFIEYIKMVLFMRQTSEGKSQQMLYKLMANAIIGKLIQQVKRYDLNQIKAIAIENKVPMSEIMKISNLKHYGVEKSLSLGSGFYPEYNCLILGYARATIAEAYDKYGAMIGTTDSFITDKYLGEKLTINGITFEKKTQGDTILILRNRLYMLWNNSECIDGIPMSGVKHIACHGFHSLNQAAKFFKEYDFEKDKHDYEKKHIVKLRESIKKNIDFGSELNILMKVRLGWDNKRVLNDDNSSSPFINLRGL